MLYPKNTFTSKKSLLFLGIFLLFIFFIPTNKVSGICANAPCVPDPAEPCGDGYRLSSEACDDGNLNNLDGCSDVCTKESGWFCYGAVGDMSTCNKCGNNTINSPEQCDGTNLNSQSCTSIGMGFTGGSLSCYGGGLCTFNTANCHKCGNGVINSPEQCDDGNQNSGDGCAGNCTGAEIGYICNNSVSPSACNPICGDGLKKGTEACDDGNMNNGDGCSNSCTVIDSGYTCPPGGGACTTVCGDGVVAGTETCDQGYGNTTPNDGCSNTCQEEYGWNCIENPCTGKFGAALISCNIAYGLNCQISDTVCIANRGRSFCNTVCGDGILAGSEVCDDGNTANGDGCNSTCTIKDPGFNCTPGSLCTTTCGDNIQAGSEMCDDGNTITEPCAYGETSCMVCRGDCLQIVPGATSYCSDGIVNGPEACDYDSYSPTQNLPIPHGGDGCTTTCTIEEGWSCFQNSLNQNVCVYHCGDEVVENTALFTEECDLGNVGKINKNTKQPTSAPFNGDACTATTYNSSCNWCDLTCKQQTARGPYCGDGVWNELNENCDDGNNASGDGCYNCEVEDGWICKGLYSTCTTKCGDGKCVATANDPNKRESCVSCSADCGICSVRRADVSIFHEENMFVNLVEKIKSTFIRPTFLIELPGLNSPEQETSFRSPPAPVTDTYSVGVPKTLNIGNQNYTFTVNSSENGIVTFSIR